MPIANVGFLSGSVDPPVQDLGFKSATPPIKIPGDGLHAAVSESSSATPEFHDSFVRSLASEIEPE